MRVIYPENSDSVLDPKQDYPPQLLPKLSPLRRFEIQGEDILIFLWRIFRVLNGAVRPFAEPLRMPASIGMVGRALKSDVERNLNSMLFGFGNQMVEVVQRPQLRMDRGVSAFFRSDCPRAAYVLGLSGNGIVFALARRVADRMDGWKVENVEAHGSYVRQPRLAIPQGSVPVLLSRARSRKKFVPRK